MMNLRRDAKETAFCGTVVLTVWYATQLGGFGPAMLEGTAAVPVLDQPAATFMAANERINIPQATAVSIPVVANAEVVKTDGAAAAEPNTAPVLIETSAAVIDAAVANEAIKSETAAPSDIMTASVDEPIVVAALSDPSSVPAPELPLVQTTATDPSDAAPDIAKPAVGRIEIVDECLEADACIDRYLWAVYLRTPKEDSVKVSERRKVAVKRKGKMVTVTKNFTRRVDQDFTWKDPDAADKTGMSMMDYVIGGMDRNFKTKLFHALYAAEQAGLSPGITSAFRDDYRQSIANGMKAATGRSYHGGSSRGGYGHGLAADVVSVDGATRAQRWVSTERFWKWIDDHGKEFGVGRPYLGRDPPHVGPIDGNEYVSRRVTRVAHAAAAIKKRSKVAHNGATKTLNVAAKSLDKRKTVQAGNPAHATKQGASPTRPRMAMAESRG